MRNPELISKFGHFIENPEIAQLATTLGKRTLSTWLSGPGWVWATTRVRANVMAAKLVKAVLCDAVPWSKLLTGQCARRTSTFRISTSAWPPNVANSKPWLSSVTVYRSPAFTRSRDTRSTRIWVTTTLTSVTARLSGARPSNAWKSSAIGSICGALLLQPHDEYHF